MTSFAFNAHFRRKLWQRIAMQLRYNVPLLIILENLCEQYSRNKALSAIFTDMKETFGRYGLAKAFRKYVPFDEILLIESTEARGELYKGFELAAKIIVAKTNISSSVKSAIAYPALLFVLLLAILFVISFTVVPALSMILDPSEWQGMARILYLIANFTTSIYGVIFAVLLVLFIGYVAYSLPNYIGEYRTLLDKIPPYSLYRMVIGATWLFTVASLMKAGKQQKDILEDMANSEICTPYLKSRIKAILENFGEGKKFGDALVLAKTDFPDNELIRDIKTYSDLPKFEEKLYDISEDWITIWDEKLKEKAKTAQGILLFVITAIMICIIYAYQDFTTLFQGV